MTHSTSSSSNEHCWSSSELRAYVFSSIRSLGLRPSHQLGQNFLIDASVIKTHIKHSCLSPSDIVLEIGPGLGNLTKCILPHVKKVYAIESDTRLGSFLSDTFSIFSNIEIIIGDALKVDWPSFNKCISNLPYQISSPVTFKLLKHDFELSVLMFQKEFAERLIAPPASKQYSRLSVMLKIHASCEYLRTIKPTSFYPPPKVESALVRIVPHPPLIDSPYFPNFVTILFNNKGRTVRAVIRQYLKGKRPDQAVLDSTLELLGEFASRRVYTLSPEEIIVLYNRLKNVLR